MDESMTIFPITSPFETFTDIDGTPLENGNIYIGTVDLNPETNPITVYWDVDLQIAATQPIRTIGGYPARSGTPARLYLDDIDYSITVRDKKNQLVFSELDALSVIRLALINASTQIDNIAELTALDVSNFTEGLAFNVLGYTAIGDGGGGDFLYTTTAVTVNGGTVFAPDSDPSGASGGFIRNNIRLIFPEFFGVVGDGITDDLVALQACFDHATAINAANPQVRATVVFGSAKTYYVSGLLNSENSSIQGNGSTILADGNHGILRIHGSNLNFNNFTCRYDVATSNVLREAIELADGTGQCSKNTYDNVVTRNAYRGWNTHGGGGANGSIWGSTFINCRADNSWDWGWYLDCATGTTTLTFIGCHGKGLLSDGGVPKGMYINNSSEVNLINMAVDQVSDGDALQIINAQAINVDILTLESCEITSADKAMVTIEGGVLNIGTINSKVGLYTPGSGNKAYLLALGATCTFAHIDTVQNIQDQAGANGDLYAIRGNNNTRIKTENVPLSGVNTQGWQELFIDVGRLKGLANSDPTSTFLKTYEVGDIALNRTPSNGENIGWICVTAGTPGVWAAFGAIQSLNAFSPTNVSTNRAYDADTVLVSDLADVVGTMISDLQDAGILK